MRRTFLLASACATLAGCSLGGTEVSEPPTGSQPETGRMQTEADVPPEPPAAEAVELRPLRPRELRRCRRLPELADVCPRLVPAGRFGPGSGAYQAVSRSELPDAIRWTFSLQQGGEHPGRPELDRPPATVHVVASAAAPFPTALPRRTRLRDGLLEERRRKPLFLGSATWGGHEGVLLLAPPFPRGGLEANHLIFSWGAGSRSVSLHGWEPFTEVPEVLRAVVESIP